MGERQIWTQDNMSVLGGIDTKSVTIAYLDPPFNSGRSYEAVLARQGAHESSKAFSDAWTWGEAAERDLRQMGQWLPPTSVELIRALVSTLGKSDLSAYLVMMASRLGELRRTLTDEGSLYLHCDPAASHYLKVILDQLFGADNFRNEIVWKRTHAHSGSRRFGPVHDVVLFYSRTKNYVWNQGFAPYSSEYIEKYFRNSDDRGTYQLITCTGPGPREGTRAHYKWKGVWPPNNRHWAWTEDVMRRYESEGRLVHSRSGVPRLKRYVDDGEGVRLQDLWLDINPLGAHAGERTGYETQKPTALLERIIASSSSPGDLVLDPFCGTGTTAVAAERLGRQWIAIDSSLLASSLTLARVRQTGTDATIELQGFPSSTRAAKQLCRDNAVTFAVWGTSLLGTMLDSHLLTNSLAFGSNSLGIGRRRKTIAAWVPLKAGAQPREMNATAGNADLGLVLLSSAGSRQLHKWLKDELSLPVQHVDLESLVNPMTTRRGIVREVLVAV